MKSLIVTFVTVLMFADFCESCSAEEDHKWKSIAELTRLAPLVLHAKVVASNALTNYIYEYNATLNVTHVYKGKLNESIIVVANFAHSGSCRSAVSVGDKKIFFLDVHPFRARYDDLYSAVVENSTKIFQGLLEGLCCPNTTDCPLHKITCRGCMTAVTSTWFFIVLLGIAIKLLVG